MKTDRQSPARPGVASTALLLLAACSSSGGSSDSGGGGSTGEPVTGGTLNMLGTGDVDYMDPNITYYSVGYLRPAAVEPPAVHLPGRSRARPRPPVPDLATEIPTTDNGGISADGKTYTIKLRPGAQWNTNPARQVTAADVVRGVKRTVQPGPAVRRHPGLRHLIVGYQDVLRRVRQGGQTPAAIADLHRQATTCPAWWPRTTRRWSSRSPSRRRTSSTCSPCRRSRRPRRRCSTYLPGSHRARRSTSLRRALPDRRRGSRPRRSPSPATRPGTRRPTRSARRTSTRSWSTRRSARTRSSSSCRPVRERRHGVRRLPAAVPAARPDRDEGPATSTSVRPRRPTRTSCSTPSRRTTQGAGERRGPAGAVLRHQPRPHHPGPRRPDDQPAADPRAAAGHRRLEGHRPRTRTTRPRPSSCWPRPATRTADAEVPLPQRVRGQQQAFQTIQQDLSKAGITVDRRAVAERGLLHEVPAGADRRRSAASGTCRWPAGAPDWYGNAALSFFNPLFSGKPSFPPVGSNFGFYDSPATNDLIKQAVAATDEDEAADLWAKADEQVMEDAAFFPITNPKQRELPRRAGAQRGLHPAIQNFDPTNVWLSRGQAGRLTTPMALLEVRTSRSPSTPRTASSTPSAGVSFDVERGETLGDRRRVRLRQERRHPDDHRPDPRRPGHR